jgi:hypothetical protein
VRSDDSDESGSDESEEETFLQFRNRVNKEESSHKRTRQEQEKRLKDQRKKQKSNADSEVSRLRNCAQLFRMGFFGCLFVNQF